MTVNKARSWAARLLTVLLGVLVLLFIASPVLAAAYYAYYLGDDDAPIPLSGVYVLAQGFQVTDDCVLTHVNIRGTRISSSTGTVYFSVRTDGPKGSIIASGSFNSADWPQGSYGWSGIKGVSPAVVYLEEGTDYYLRINSDSSDAKASIDAFTDEYSGGSEWFSTDSGDTFTEYTDNDLNFGIYGDALPTFYPPTDFTATRTGVSTVNLTWTVTYPSVDTHVYVSSKGYPSDLGTGWLVYSGNGTTVLAEGVPEFVTYYFSAWGGYETFYSENASDALVEGDDMDVNLAMDNSFIVLGVACFLLFMTIFLKKMLLYIALAFAWLMVILTCNNVYLDGVAGIVMLFSIIQIVKIRKGTEVA